MFDFAESPDLSKLVAQFHESNKIVSAVCHGPAGLVNVKRENGDYLIAGKDLIGFSWNEEAKVGRDEAVPFNREEQLQAQGAKYSKAWMAFYNHVVDDGLLITGQNPTSAQGVGTAVVKALRASHS